ncbi:glycoside hydrolase family 3 protein [Pseudolysinimonas yzui]|nr:glycoside hydrolase family 3 N-terminal domain-containing protein [Pseudolysinimonas yzui]
MDLRKAPFALDDGGVDWVESTLEIMTVEQKVGQVLCVYLHSTDMAEWTAWLAEREIEPGAMMLTARPRLDARTHVAELQEWSSIPLLIAGNLESGAVNFLSDTEAFANPMQVAATGDVLHAQRLAEHCARVANEVGITWAFAPVIDLAMNPQNPITNTRTFGSDPAVVAEFGAVYIEALESRGIATSPKHFPGDGVDDRDQHLATTSNDLDADSWWATFGEVYRRTIAAGTRTIMVGHIRQPALSRAARPGIADAELLPASLAPELVTGVLREQLGFNGLIVTDNSAMTGFTTVMARGEALAAALNAGVDMILGNVDVEEDFALLLAAVRDGRISGDRIDDAVRRVLAVKSSIGLPAGTDRADRDLPDVEQERAWRDEVAARAVTLVKDTQRLLPLDPARHRRVLVCVIGDEPTFYDPSGPFAPQFVDGLRARGFEVEQRTVPHVTTAVEASRLHERFDVFIYFAVHRFIGNANTSRVSWAPWQGFDAPRHVVTLPTALVSIADPYLLQDLPMVRTAINCYTPTPSTVDAAIAVLVGERPALGRSPVDPFAGHWDAAL